MNSDIVGDKIKTIMNPTLLTFESTINLATQTRAWCPQLIFSKKNIKNIINLQILRVLWEQHHSFEIHSLYPMFQSINMFVDFLRPVIIIFFITIFLIFFFKFDTIL